MLKNNLKNFFLGFIFLLMNVFSFAEIPHSYVTENPKKEVQKVEAFKQRDKAELNLSVTKIKAKEIKDGNISYYTNGKFLKISLEKNLYNLEVDDKFLVSESGENIFSINRFKLKNTLKSDTKLCKATDIGTLKEITLNFDYNPKMVYLTILDKDYNIKEILKYSNIKEVTDEVIRGETDLYLTERYQRGSKFEFSCLNYNNPFHDIILNYGDGIFLKKISGYGLVNMDENDILVINDTQKIKIETIGSFSEIPIEIKVNSNQLRIEGRTGNIVFKEIINTKATVDNYSLKLQLLRNNKLIMEHKFNVHTKLFTKIENDVKFEFEIIDYKKENIIDIGITEDSTSTTYGQWEGLKLVNRAFYKLNRENFQLKLLENETLKRLKINNQEIKILDEKNYPSKILTLENNLKVELVGGKKLTFKLLDYRENNFSLNIEEEKDINTQLMNTKLKIVFIKSLIDKTRYNYRTDTNWNIKDEYEGEWIEHDYWNGGYGEPWDRKGLNLRTWSSNHPAFHADALGNYSLLPLEGTIESLTVNGVTIPEAKGIQPEFSGTLKIREDYIIEYRTKKSNPNIFTYRFIKYPKEDFKLDLYLKFFTKDNKFDHRYVSHYQYIPPINPQKLIGNSILNFGEEYIANTYINFSANDSINDTRPLQVENSVQGVTFNTTGQGLVVMQQGDKLTVGGHEAVIEAGGNIEPQKLTIGNVKYTYEVKNAKFRIALNEWGVLEPDRTIPIKIVRNENGKDKSLAEHNLTIKAPRRVEGTSNIKLNQDYDIRSIIKFNGISLKAPGKLQLESTTAGVSLTNITGQGIPFMKEGDRLEISDGLTKAVKAFTIGANGTLGKQQVKLNNGELIVFVEGGKLRVGVNNYLSNSIISAKLDLIRGTNEIMNHTLEIKTPDAPFNIKKKGILDFGNVTAGSKRTAETEIVLEMLKDVNNVKFSLKDPQPILENLDKSNNLKVNNITYLSENKEREYKIKLKGNLTIPENTKSGLYTGNTVLELQIK